MYIYRTHIFNSDMVLVTCTDKIYDCLCLTCNWNVVLCNVILQWVIDRCFVDIIKPLPQ